MRTQQNRTDKREEDRVALEEGRGREEVERKGNSRMRLWAGLLKEWSGRQKREEQRHVWLLGHTGVWPGGSSGKICTRSPWARGRSGTGETTVHGASDTGSQQGTWERRNAWISNGPAVSIFKYLTIGRRVRERETERVRERDRSNYSATATGATGGGTRATMPAD